MIDPQALQALVAIERTGSVAAAAASLGFTPSAVSQQVKKLERQARATLLERQGRGVLLTERGRVLALRGAALLASLEELESELTEEETPSGVLRLASFSSANRAFLGNLATSLRRLAPDLALQVAAAEPEEGARKVAAGEVDLAIVHNWNSVRLEVNPSVETSPLLHDVADVLLPAAHPLAARRELTVLDVQDEPWCATPPGAICHEALLRLFATQDTAPRILFTDPEFATHIALVDEGAALALVPRLGRPELPAGVVARTLIPGRSAADVSPEDLPARHISVAYRKTFAANPGVRLAVRELERIATELA
ncbi:LysR family transcriptional regulator [Arthrobacter sp. NPDC090010]|uniref:LysR family transcriptional regulator n=1 Tax=Arthrobacter sp. NPDC090010 TaxID=3363942 RepID=UPI003803C560